jgi:hypothetical protein
MLGVHMIAARQDRARAISRAGGTGSDGYLHELEKWTWLPMAQCGRTRMVRNMCGTTDLTGCAI